MLRGRRVLAIAAYGTLGLFLAGWLAAVIAGALSVLFAMSGASRTRP